jgi:hypothetical protein
MVGTTKQRKYETIQVCQFLQPGDTFKIISFLDVLKLLRIIKKKNKPIPMAARWAWGCCRSLAGIPGWNSAGGMDVCVLCDVR